MQWFGKSWGAEFCQENEHIDTPIAKDCTWCGEPITKDDSGVVMLHLQMVTLGGAIGFGLEPGYWHYECYMRTIIGGANHQLERCTCFGGDQPSDPPELSRREQAKRAVEVYRKTEAAKWN